LKNDASNLTVSNVVIEKETLKLKVSSSKLDTETVKVHIFSNHFCSEKFGNELNISRKNCPKFNSESFIVKTNFNSYQSEARIHDEIKYVYDRRKKEKFIGNTLEKPMLLLKRTFNRETTEDTEVLREA